MWTDCRSMVRRFHQLLTECSKLIAPDFITFFIDGTDDFDASHRPTSLSWLPEKIPPVCSSFVLSMWLILLFCCYSDLYISALTLLVGRQEEHPAYKNWVMRCWCGYLSGAGCRSFAYGPADAPSTLASFKSRLVLPFWVLAYPGCPGKEAVKRVQ